MTDITKVVSTTLISEGADPSQVSVAGKITSDKSLSGYLLSQAEARKDKSIGALQWIIDFVKRLVELILGLTDKKKTDSLNADARTCAEKFFAENKTALQNLAKPGELSSATGNLLSAENRGHLVASRSEPPLWRKILGGRPGVSLGPSSGGNSARSHNDRGAGRSSHDRPAGSNPNSEKRKSSSFENDVDLDRTTTGTLIEHGEDFYQHKAPEGDKKRAKKNYFVKIKLGNGETITRWGKELQNLILKENPLIGDEISLTLLGKERVVTDVSQPKAGSPGKFEIIQKEVDRNKWVLEFIEEKNSPKRTRPSP